jgi:hypothetical protein
VDIICGLFVGYAAFVNQQGVCGGVLPSFVGDYRVGLIHPDMTTKLDGESGFHAEEGDVEEPEI